MGFFFWVCGGEREREREREREKAEALGSPGFHLDSRSWSTSPGLGPHRLGSPGFVERETEKNLRTLEQGADDEDEADLLPPTMKTKLWNTRRWTVDSADLLPPETKPKPPWLLFVISQSFFQTLDSLTSGMFLHY